jgi:uncharacterized protein YukE
MADRFGARPAELRGVARDAEAVGAQAGQVVSTLREQLGAIGAAWGHDSTGAQFAEGANGYVVQSSAVLGAADAVPAFLADLGGLLKQVADSVEQTDGA